MKTQLMSDLMSELNDDEIKDLNEWVSKNLSPLNNIVVAVKDLNSTDESGEKLADAINELFDGDAEEVE